MSKILLIAALLSLCACTSSHTVTTHDGTVTFTDKGKDQGSVHVAGKNGESMDINSGKPITDYPSDTPLYEGKSVMDIKADQKHSRVVTLQTPDSAEKISSFYKAQLESKGWKTESTVDTPQMTMFVATKETRQLTITIASDSDAKLQTISQALADK